MTSPTLELTAAIVPGLKAFAPLAALIGDRVFDDVPADGEGFAVAQLPYVSLGAAHEISTGPECVEAVEIMFRIDAWSDAVGFGEVMQIAEAVKRALHRAEFELADNALVEITHRRTDRLRAPDGLISQAIVEFSATIETL